MVECRFENVPHELALNGLIDLSAGKRETVVKLVTG